MKLKPTLPCARPHPNAVRSHSLRRAVVTFQLRDLREERSGSGFNRISSAPAEKRVGNGVEAPLKP
eukprot:2783398-Prymnesium_polylepis.1